MDIGAAGPVESAQPGDERVDVLVRVLEDRPWSRLSPERLCADLVAALDAGQTQRDAFHSYLQGLLEER